MQVLGCCRIFLFSFSLFFSSDVRAPLPQTPDSSSVPHGVSLSSHSLCHAVLPSHFLAHTQRQTASWLASQSTRQGALCNPGDGAVPFSCRIQSCPLLPESSVSTHRSHRQVHMSVRHQSNNSTGHTSSVHCSSLCPDPS